MDENTAANTLIDIGEAIVDRTMPKDKRIKAFVLTIKNPYLYRYGDIQISAEFTKGGPKMNDCLRGIICL